MNYSLILKNEKTKNYRNISLLLVLFNLLGFVFLFVNKEAGNQSNLFLLCSVFLIATYIFLAVLKRIFKNPFPDTWHRLLFFYCSIVWLYDGFWWLSIALLIINLLDILANRILEVKISDEKIILPSIPKKEINWNELNNLLVKDGLLTIDFKNNKLFQQLLQSSDLDEKEFNEFCKRHLNN